MSAPVLVCFAVPQEARPFQRRFGSAPGASILVTGMGSANADRSVRAALGAISCVCTCGFAGALDPALQIGDVLFETLDQAATAKLVAARARPARFCCCESVAVTAAAKAALRQETGADAVEMESGIIQRICAERGIPCVTIRAISDRADEDLPLDFNQLLTGDHRLSPFKLALAIARAPQRIPALLRLGRNSAAAADRLAGVLGEFLR